MVKKVVRIILSTLVSGVVLEKIVKIGFGLNILKTTAQWNLCLWLGIVLITILNLQILMEKEQKTI